MNPMDFITTTLPAIATALPVVTSSAAWVLAHWLQIGEVVAALVAIYWAIRNHQWNRIIDLAGELAYDVALLTEFDKAKKREVVTNELYAMAGPVARRLFTREQFGLAVEMGWKLIAKPKVQSEGA